MLMMKQIELSDPIDDILRLATGRLCDSPMVVSQ